MAEGADATNILFGLTAASIFGYLLGSIPFGLVLTRAAGLGDVRNIGSGNIGATNVLRTGNKALALATLLLDGGKGAIAVLIARLVGLEDVATVAGGAAFLGHIFPVWLKFKGGKGVATFFGTLFAIYWPVGLMAAGTWLVTAAVSRMSSLGALTTALFVPFYFWLAAQGQHALLAIFMAVLIFVRHRENIQRLLSGTEPKIGTSSS